MASFASVRHHRLRMRPDQLLLLLLLFVHIEIGTGYMLMTRFYCIVGCAGEKLEIPEEKPANRCPAGQEKEEGALLRDANKIKHVLDFSTRKSWEGEGLCPELEELRY